MADLISYSGWVVVHNPRVYALCTNRCTSTLWADGLIGMAHGRATLRETE